MNLISFEQQDKKRGPLSFAIFAMLAILIVGLVGWIVQAPKAQQIGVTNDLPVFETPPNSPIASEPTLPPVVQAQAEMPKPPTAPVRSREYKIAQGDTFGTIARKFHVSVQAIEEANPGVKPNRLKIGQVIQIPVAVASAPNPGALARR